VPGHVYRSPNGSGEWFIGPFVADEGDPDAEPPVPPTPTLDTPGAENEGGGVGPVVEEVRIIEFQLDFDTGRAVISATGLGTKIWMVEVSDDLNATDAWAPVPGGFGEQDQEDGSTDFIFFEVTPVPAGRFYRLAEDN
jgi:hypothetical protein